MIEFLGATGPGSQPVDEDGSVLEYMEMPKGMATFRAPILPEPGEVSGLGPAKEILRAIQASLETWQPGQSSLHELSGLDRDNLEFVGQALGDGEVSVISGETIQCQESVMAGVWRLRETGADGRLVSDRVEVGAFPQSIMAKAFAGSRNAVEMPGSFGPGIFNAPPLLVEINDAVSRSGLSGNHPHVINLSLLPHTEEDLTLIDRLLGTGPVTILSRGYGNCRVMTSGVRDTWWVRYYNSQDAVILNSIEVTSIPDVVCASPEDIADSAGRLEEILEVYR